MSRPVLLLLSPFLGMGGAQRVMHDQAVALAEQFKVIEAAFDLGDGYAFPSGNEVVDLATPGARGIGGKAAAFGRRIARLRRLKRERKVELTISHLEGAHWVSALSGGPDRKIFIVHGSLANDAALGKVKGFLVRRLFVPLFHNRADRVVTVSRDLVAELVSLGVRREKIVTINNFFDIGRIEALAAEPLPPEHATLFEGPPVLVNTGRLHVQKNQAALIDLFAELRETRPARLVIVGDGELREELAAHAAGHGLKVHAAWRGGEVEPSDEIIFLGQQDNPFRYLARGTVFVLPSLWEGFPLALCEAMACGVPVAASDCPTGPREIVAPSLPADAPRQTRVLRGDHGLLLPMPVDKGTRSEWARALGNLLDQADERAAFAQAGRTRVRDFSAERIVPQWVALIREVLRGD